MAQHAPYTAVQFASLFAPRAAKEESANPYAQQVRGQAIEFLYRNIQNVVVTVLLVPVLLAAALWTHVDPVLLVSWCAAMALVVIARVALRRLYFNRQPPPDEAPRWGRYFACTSLANGLLWGSAGVLFFVPDVAPLQVLLYTSVIGVATGSLIGAAFLPSGFYAFAIPVLAMSAARLAWEGSTGYVALAGLLLLQIVVQVPVARNIHRAALTSLRLGFQNLDLVQALSEQRDIAERASVAKSKFLAAASHDLRQPLHALGLFTSVLDAQVKGRKARQVVDHIGESVRALQKMFDVLLDVSRLDAGVLPPQPRHFRLHDLFRALGNDYGPEAAAKGLTLECDGADVVVHSDPALLERILRNYVANAVRYTDVGGVRVECTAVDEAVRIDVTDTGIGIAPENLSEIFDEFHQLNNPERDRRKGLGLGLAIVERAARLLDHPIQVESVPGRGSRFSVTVPRGDVAHIYDGADPATAAIPGDLSGLGVVIVEDDATVRTGMRALLEQWRCRVIAVASEDEAVAAIRTGFAPDAIVADYRLRKERTGVQAIHRLRQELQRDLPALVVTGDTGAERLREAKASGHQVVHKPVGAATLRAFLGNARASVRGASVARRAVQ